MKWVIVRVGMILVAAGALVEAAADAPPAGVPQGVVPSVSVPVSDAPPFLDGKLDDACWKTAGVLAPFHVFGALAETAPQTVRLTRDAGWLYVAFEIVRPYPGLIHRTIFEQDGGVLRDDSLEVFIDPGTGGAWYVHYMLNAANVKADELIVKRGRDSGCRMTWRSATRVTETGWNAELAIPLRALTIYAQHGACNLADARIACVIKVFEPKIDAYNTVEYETERQFVWPALDAFYNPVLFGRLNGIPPDGGANFSELFLASFQDVRLTGYAVRDGAPGYEVAVALGASTGTVGVRVEDRPAGGEISEVRRDVALSKGGREALTIHVPVRQPGLRSALVWLEDVKQGGAFASSFMDEQTMTMAEPLDVLPDRNYYTRESAARLACRVRLAPETRAVCRLEIKDASGRTLARADRLAEEFTLDVPLKDLPDGRTDLSVELLQADGTRLVAHGVPIVKRPPNKGSEVKVDQINRVILKDGTPVFPFGILVTRLSSKNEVLFQRLGDAGFNTMIWWCRLPEIPADEVRACLDLAQAHGLMVVDTVNIKPRPFKGGGARSLYLNKQGGQKLGQTVSLSEEMTMALKGLDAMTPGLESTHDVLKAHPAYLASWNVDEPYDEPCVAVAERYYKWMTERDPYHPLVLLYMRRIPPGRRWTDWGEVLAYDVYIYPGFKRFVSLPPSMALTTEHLRQRADGLHKVSWIMPMTEGLNITRCPRTLRPDEQRCQTYMAVIHGAKGLLYFCGPALYTKMGWDALSGLAREMQVLGPAAVAPPVPQQVAYEPGAMDIGAQTFPDVHAVLFRHPDGRLLLMAANGQRYPVDVRFEVSVLTAGGRARRLFQKADCAVKQGGFSDRFEAYGTRAYALEGSAGTTSPVGPVSLRVTMTSHPEEALPDPAFEPASEVVKRRNVVPNPSLEQMSSPGLPDYIRPYNDVFHYCALVGEPGAVWGVETNRPFHGLQCARMGRPADAKGASSSDGVTTAALCYVPSLKGPTPYVFSVYLRAAADGQEVKVTVEGMKPDTETFKLTTEWQRYVLKGVLSSGGAKPVMLAPVKSAEVWMDALQMEKGTEPTSFTLE